jgi:hypothetical protein
MVAWGDIGARAELKSMRYFRNTWSRLSVDRQVTQAIEQGPENAGPLNSHLLVLRSLALMRDISPDYLNRFVSYVDTLLWLDQADRKNRPREQAGGKPGGSLAPVCCGMSPARSQRGPRLTARRHV